MQGKNECNKIESCRYSVYKLLPNLSVSGLWLDAQALELAEPGKVLTITFRSNGSKIREQTSKQQTRELRYASLISVLTELELVRVSTLSQ